MDVTKNISFKLKNIEIGESSLKNLNYALPTDVIYKFTINIDHLLNVEENLIVIKPIVDIFIDESGEILANLSASLIFEVENLSHYVFEKEVKLPSDVIIALNSISISTVRGIMFSAFKGTYLHNAILPVVDPKAFLPNK